MGALLLLAIAPVAQSHTPGTPDQSTQTHLKAAPAGSVRANDAANFTVVFLETGLPSGTNWTVTLPAVGPYSRVMASNTSTIVFDLPNGSYHYTVGVAYGYHPNWGQGLVPVNGSGRNVSLVFTAGALYSVTFGEIGLFPGPPFAGFNLTIFNANQTPIGFPGYNVTTRSPSTLGFSEPNGSYSYRVWSAYGQTASPASGNLSVDGSNLSVLVVFTLLSGFYNVTFRQSGLPSGIVWAVDLTDRAPGTGIFPTSSTVAMLHPNGSFHYAVGSVDSSGAFLPWGADGFPANPPSGTVTVNGSNVTVLTVFGTLTNSSSYTVTFAETGLALGTNWSVDLGGTVNSSVSAELTFRMFSGSYGYLVGAVNGYSLSGSAGGILSVNGAAVKISVAFQPTSSGLFPLTFRAAGLGSGANWSVNLTANSSGLTIDSVPSFTRWSDGGSSILFLVSQGEYYYSTSAPGGSASGGTVNVTGSGPQTVVVSFGPSSHGPGPKGSALSLPLWAEVGAAGIAVIALLLIGAPKVAFTVRQYRSREEELGRFVVAEIADAHWQADAQGEPVATMAR
ncbi:MAG: hypothetical protein L3K09_04430 [Thermoplasmata archaeon]|nr:hypothetical protein [Thermoplasmata archaeon]